MQGSLTQIGDERQLHFFDAFDLVFEDLEPEFMPKAVRNFCALLAHHLELAERFTPELRRRFEARGAAMVRALPADLVAAAVPRMSVEREQALRACSLRSPPARGCGGRKRDAGLLRLDALRGDVPCGRRSTRGASARAGAGCWSSPPTPWSPRCPRRWTRRPASPRCAPASTGCARGTS
ncbi:hypothetical protein [Nonomuraea dietziae]|uniref:hypothetical protein n=1 Tax=Nonomuraea dietziae TaxID=65515 RepID=UPI0031CF9D7A